MVGFLGESTCGLIPERVLPVPLPGLSCSRSGGAAGRHLSMPPQPVK